MERLHDHLNKFVAQGEYCRNRASLGGGKRIDMPGLPAHWAQKHFSDCPQRLWTLNSHGDQVVVRGPRSRQRS